MRAFVAIDLPDAVRAALEAVQDELPVGRPVGADTLHLTLAFLGELPDAMAEAVHDALCDLRAPGFDLALHGLGTFGGRSPSVLWAGVRPDPALSLLRDRVRGAVRRAGLDLPRERFRPHVTLARYRTRLRREDVARLSTFLARYGGIGFPSFRVSRITLFRSLLLPDGARHEVLAEYPLSD